MVKVPTLQIIFRTLYFETNIYMYVCVLVGCKTSGQRVTDYLDLVPNISTLGISFSRVSVENKSNVNVS